MVFAETVFVAVVMILGRHAWGYCYSSEERVVKYVGELLILIAILHVIDGIQAILSGNFNQLFWSLCFNFIIIIIIIYICTMLILVKWKNFG